MEKKLNHESKNCSILEGERAQFCRKCDLIHSTKKRLNLHSINHRWVDVF